jgi:PAS domain S-box-containing protein
MAGAAAASYLIGARFGEVAQRTDANMENLRNSIRRGYSTSTFEAQTIDHEGNRTYRIRNRVGIVENGMLVRVWGTTRDIGDLRRAELERQASERRFRQLLETIRMAAVMLDPEGKVTFCNDYLLGLTGWSWDDIAGRNWFDLMIPEKDRDRLRAAFFKAIAGSVPRYRLENTLLRRDGARRLLDWDNTILRDGEGKIVGTASLGRDITDQRELQTRLHEAQRLESVGKLASGIAHDFNNLLTIIRGYAELLLAAHSTGPLHSAVEEVIRASEQGSALTRQLLSFSRSQPVNPRPLKLNDVVAENQKMLRRLVGEKIELILDLEPSPRTVLADPGQIHQMLVNLAMNARDAMPEGGKLIITSRAVEVGETGPADMPDVRPGSYVMLAVADTGTGLTEEARAHLFEPFFTTKHGRGTGLGLASVYGIVRQSGGQIAVDSAPGKGATFRVLLPVAEGGTAPQGDRGPAARGEPETILLVDDKPALLGLAAKALRSFGFEVVEAGAGQEALSAAEKYPKRIDLLLTDLAMPDMEGTELAERLKAKRPDLKVLYMSGYTDDLPGEAYIQKPFTTRELAAKVRDVLGPGDK